MKHIPAILIALVSISWSHSTAAEPKRPNILLIYADDQSYKTVGCYPESFPWVKTPNIDRLAAAGVRFHAAYLGSWCMPSRAALLTGRHPHGVETMRMEGKYPGSAYDPNVCRFWPSVFREHGYHTAQIGKWHTGVAAGWGRDWDYQIVWNRPLHPDNAGAYYERQLLAINGEEQWVDGYPADNYTEWAVDYVRGQHRDADKPWFLWLCYGSIHGPSKPAERHKGLYANADVPVPRDIFPPRPGKPAYLNDTQAWTKDADGTPVAGKSGEAFGDESGAKRQSFANFVRQMNECVPAVDEGVGKLLDALRETAQLENTLVIYTADQGFGMGEHGFRTKLGPYDATYRSPLIVAQPGLTPAGKVCDTPVNAPDLVATFVAQAGVKIPWSTHGRDLTPLLKNPAAPWPHPCLYEHTGHHYGSDVVKTLRDEPNAAVHNNVPWYVAVVEEGWKLIHYLKPGVGDELYDLKNDPDELINHITTSEHKGRLMKLRVALKSELERTQAGFGALADDDPTVLNLWPGKPPGESKELPAEADLTKPADRLIAGRRIIKLGNVSTPQIAVYRPSQEKDTGAAVLICPGGGHNILAYDLEGTEVAEWLNSIGVTGIVLKYRVPFRDPDKRWLAAVQDAQRAMSLLRSKAGEWGIDPQRIGILGFSAGGETAALTSLFPDQRQYAAIDEIDKTSSRPDFALLIYTGGLLEKGDDKLRDYVRVTKDAPPMFFVHAFDDGVSVQNSLLLASELKKSGVSTELHVFATGGHGYGLRPTSEPVTHWPVRAGEWLRERGFFTPGNPVK